MILAPSSGAALRPTGEEFEAQLRADEAPALDAAFAAQQKESPTFRWSSAHGTWATGTKSPRKFMARILDFTLADGVAEAIACPTLVCEAESDLFFEGQPQMLYDHLKCPRTLMRFTNAEGAGAHCHVGASRLALGPCSIGWTKLSVDASGALCGRISFLGRQRQFLIGFHLGPSPGLDAKT